MPIYEYRCGSCGFEKEYLQKVSDTPVAACPACGSDAFIKLISAAGFQLKGSGWYATDFKNGSQPKPKAETEVTAEKKTDGAPAAPSGTDAPCSACAAD
jgi:putative FmdB family regulatory protein